MAEGHGGPRNLGAKALEMLDRLLPVAAASGGFVEAEMGRFPGGARPYSLHAGDEGILIHYTFDGPRPGGQAPEDEKDTNKDVNDPNPSERAQPGRGSRQEA